MSEELRVLQYVRVLDNGGIESLIFNLLDKTERNRVNYDFLLLRDQIESHEDDIQKYNSQKIIVNIDLSGNIFSRYKKLYLGLLKYFENCPYKIVHFQAVGTSFGGSLALLAAKKSGIPIRIVHAHSADYKTNVIRRIDILLGQWFHKKWGTHFMACSDKAAQFSFGKNYKKHCKVIILNNGIDTDKFRFDEAERIRVRQEYDIENKFVIGSIGRLSPQKNHIFMLDVLKEVLKIKDNAVLLVVGSSSTNHEEYAEMLKKTIDSSELKKHVIFTGEIKDANRIYNGFDVYLFPSLWEGLGIAAIEAQTNGLPVFASNNVPIEAKITSNFHYLSLEDSAKKWAEKICENCHRKDEYDKVISAGYDISSSAKKLTQYYLSLNKRIEENSSESK